MGKLTAKEMWEKSHEYDYLSRDYGVAESALADIPNVMEQYAAQQVQNIETDRQKGWAWSEKLAALKDAEQARADQAEKQLSEVTRQRDEAIKLLGGNEREYYKDFCRQIENEKKDEQ